MHIYNAEEILVIILSVTLAVFLILAIFTVVKLNQLLTQVQRITDKAENFVNKAETVGEFLSQSAGPLALGKLIASIGDAAKNRKRKDRD